MKGELKKSRWYHASVCTDCLTVQDYYKPSLVCEKCGEFSMSEKAVRDVYCEEKSWKTLWFTEKHIVSREIKEEE